MWKIINWLQQSILIHPLLRSGILRIGGAKIAKSARVWSGNFFGSPDIEISDGVFINVNGFFDGSASIVIGPGVRIGPHVKILTGTHQIRDDVIRRHKDDPVLRGAVTIGQGSWIGIGAIILPGVNIGEGCVIAAGAVVVKDTVANGLYAGVPAQLIRPLPINSL